MQPTKLWNDQINSCVNKANQMICFIARNLISREKSLIVSGHSVSLVKNKMQNKSR